MSNTPSTDVADIACRDCARTVEPTDTGRFVWVCHCGWRYGDRNPQATR